MAWKEGEKIGQYILGKQLGQGGMATVYLGHHQHLDREVAIKVIHQNFLEDAGFVARFKREAQIVAKLNHPHIVPVYDFDEFEGLPYLVMKYVQGKTLKQQMMKDPLDLQGILYVMSAVGSALSYAHREGVLHRDVKPSNVVIDKDNTPYLTDFGLARLASQGESTMSADMLLGTPHYISPEQARGVKDLDGRTDIYSLGVVMYELLVGHVPYTGDTPYSIIHDHIYSPLPMPSKINPEIPPAVEMVLYKALEKKPEDRYATADELVNDLRSAINESNMTGLSPERVNAAAVSIAKNREDLDNQLTITPSPAGIASPIPSSSSGLRVATIQKPKRVEENERIWPIGGCASLLIIVFLAIGTILNMSQNLLELSALSQDIAGGNEAPNLLIPQIIDIPQEYAQLGVVLQDGDFPSLIIPDVPLDQAPENPSEPIGYLVRARALYMVEDVDGARQSIVDGLPDENQAVYLASAAQVARVSGDTEVALILSIGAVEKALDESPALYTAIRPVAGQFIYDTAGTTERINLTTTLRGLEADGLLGEGALSAIGDSPITTFAMTRNLISNGNYVLAERRLERITEDNPFYAEFLLLKVDLAIALGNNEHARENITAIGELSDVPQWVQDRADELLDTLD